MAVDDTTLMGEVRVLTDYDSSLISDGDLLSLIELGKTELRAEADNPSLTFYSGNAQADRALFWLVCLFCKVKAGELDAPSLQISELEIQQQAMDEQSGFWFDNLSQRLSGLRGDGAFGHVKGQRRNRTYRFDN